MKYKITLDRRREKKDGTYPVVVEIRNREKLRISTNYSSKPNNWDDDKMFIKNRAMDNIVLKRFRYEIDKLIFEIEDSGTYISDKVLKNRIMEIVKPGALENKKDNRLLHCIDEYRSHKKNAGTRLVYTTTYNKVAAFDPQCTFDTIDLSWLRRFEEWMAKTMKVNAYSIHLRNIRTVFNYAIDEGYTTLYPFRKFRIKNEQTKKRSLTVEQLRMLRDYPCEEYQERYRDIFMLMFYMIGINAADLLQAKHSQVVNGRLEYKRAKTGKLYSVLIQPEAQALIDKYRGDDYLLNIMDTYHSYKNFLNRMRVALKQIGELERVGRGGKKIRKPLFEVLSSYWSRHSWATIAAELDIPIDTISEALGHSHGCPTTQIYVNFNQKKVDKANRKVIDYVNKGDLICSENI